MLLASLTCNIKFWCLFWGLHCQQVWVCRCPWKWVQIYPLWLSKSTWIFDNNFDYKIQLCFYLFPLLECGVLHMGAQFQGHFHKQVWEKKLGICINSWGYCYYWTNWPFFSLHVLCPYTINLEFYAKGKFGGIRKHGVNGH